MDELLIKLPIYEGPLDLLLHLIQKNQVTMDDIPVAAITAQYLEYLNFLESLNLEPAADFLVMAATLTHIKSRLLLPSEEEDEAEQKISLIRPLLENLGLNLQAAASSLGSRPLLGRDVFGRGGAPAAMEASPGSETPEVSLPEASLLDLMAAFRRLAAGAQPAPTLEFVVETKSLGQRLKEIQEFLKARPQSVFEDLCAEDRNRNEIILSFLAVLELARIGFLRLYQDFSAPDSGPPCPARPGDHTSAGLRVFLADPEAQPEDWLT